jgi:hypothetical protein
MAMVYVPGAAPIIAVKVPKVELPDAKRVSIGETMYFHGCRTRTLESCGAKVTSCDDPIPEYAGRSGALHIPSAISVDAGVLQDMARAHRP